MLNAEADTKLRAALDGPPAVDRRTVIREIARSKQGIVWVRNLVAAIRGPGKLTADEFFYYGLHRAGMTKECTRSYVGKNAQRLMHNACNDPHWFAPCHDKALFYTVLAGAGLPAPETLAVLGPKGRCGYSSAELSIGALTSVLRDSGEPVFAKPIDGMYSVGAMVIESPEVFVRGHGAMSAGTLVDYMGKVAPKGYMIQKILAPHPDLADTVSAVPSLRLLVIANDTPVVLSAVLKMPAASNVADNFWRSGNAIAAVQEGRISRAIVSRQLQPPAESPALVGRAVPDWERATTLVLDAARLFPAIRTQSWDVALTDNGPVLLELNFGGDLNLHQLSHDCGILTSSYREHLKRCGYKGQLS